MIATREEIFLQRSIGVSRYRRRSQHNRYIQNLLAVIQPHTCARPKLGQPADPVLPAFLRVAV
jgi:hypothetical protein